MPRYCPNGLAGTNCTPTYTANITIPGKIKNVVIDPSQRLADVNMLNNRRKGNVDVNFDSSVWNFPDWKRYQLNLRPDVWVQCL